MKRETFLLIGAISQLFSGIFFLFFTKVAASQLMKETTDTALLLEKNIGIFSIAFGLVTFFCRKSPDTIALKAIFIGTLFYLIASTSMDTFGVLNGTFSSQGWAGIIVRLFFIIGYFYFLSKMKINQTTI
jgi:hypothetical protein